ncbi:MAG: ATP-binding protein [Desulfovibrio sp.]
MFWLTLPATLESLEPLREFCATKALELGCDELLLPRLELVLEELAVNVVSHAYGDTRSGDITVGCGIDAGAFLLEIQDQGMAFDPLDASSPDVDADIEERPIGGLGIFLVRDMASKLIYAREDDKNILRVYFDQEAA